MSNTALKEAYRAERGCVITTLHNSIITYAEILDSDAKYDRYPNKESSMFLQAYSTAATTLLQLMKEEIEESEETSHE